MKENWYQFQMTGSAGLGLNNGHLGSSPVECHSRILNCRVKSRCQLQQTSSKWKYTDTADGIAARQAYVQIQLNCKYNRIEMGQLAHEPSSNTNDYN